MIVMPTYRIPLTWEVYVHVTVTAPTQDETIEYALGPDCPLPEEDYVDNSVRVNDLVNIKVLED